MIDSCAKIFLCLGWQASDLKVQHDIHEVFRILFDVLTDGSHSKETDSSPPQKNYNNDSNVSFSDLFCGTVIDHIESVDEKKQSGEVYQTTKVDSFMDLQLAIRDVSSVEEAIESFLKSEEMKGDNQWCCEELGNKKIDAVKNLKLAHLPYILTLQLKRVDYQTNTPVKVSMNLFILM